MFLDPLRVSLEVSAARLASVGADAVRMLLWVGSALGLIGPAARAVRRFERTAGQPALHPCLTWLMPVMRLLFPVPAAVPARIEARVPPANLFDQQSVAAADLRGSNRGRSAVLARSGLALVPPVVSSADVYSARPWLSRG